MCAYVSCVAHRSGLQGRSRFGGLNAQVLHEQRGRDEIVLLVSANLNVQRVCTQLLPYVGLSASAGPGLIASAGRCTA